MAGAAQARTITSQTISFPVAGGKARTHSYMSAPGLRELSAVTQLREYPDGCGLRHGNSGRKPIDLPVPRRRRYSRASFHCADRDTPQCRATTLIKRVLGHSSTGDDTRMIDRHIASHRKAPGTASLLAARAVQQGRIDWGRSTRKQSSSQSVCCETDH